MNPWLKTALLVLAGGLGGVAAIIVLYFAVALLVSPVLHELSLLFAAFVTFFAIPLVGGLGAMWAGAWLGRILDRLD